MAVFFGMPDDDAKDLLARAMREWHPVLTKLGVRVQIIMAASDNDTPAVKHDGHAALASIRIVGLKDRLTKQYDAEMLVSRQDYDTMSEAGRLAMFDHELSHIDPVKKEKKQRKGYKGPKQYYVPLDDLGRPKLKLKLGDWSAGDGFAAVVSRHGDDAIEFENLRRAYKFAERAKSGDWQPDDEQGGEITDTVDRDDIGTQLDIPFDEVEVSSAADAAERVIEDVAKTYVPFSGGALESRPLAEPAPAYEVGGPREVTAPFQTYHDDKSHVPAGERHGNSPPIAEVPSWRKMPLSETGWEDEIDPELWAAIGVKCWTVGELADELLRGETFGALLTDVEVVLALVEQISSDDEAPIRFEIAEAESVTERPREDFPADQAGYWEYLLANRSRPLSPNDQRTQSLVAEWRERERTGQTEPVWGKWSEFSLLLASNDSVRVCYVPNQFGVDHLEFFGEAISSTGYRSDFQRFGEKDRPEITLEAFALRRAEELRRSEMVEKPKRERAAKRDAKNKERASDIPAVPVTAPATKLADLVGFHDAVGDALLLKGITTVETLMEALAEYRTRVGLDDLPLRNQLVTYFVADLGGVKVKPCEWAADAVAKHLAPKPEPAKPHSIADTGIALVIRTDGSAPLLKKLTKKGVKTIGELCEWVDREYAADGGMADKNGSGLYSAFCALTAARTASLASDAVQSFLRAHNLMAVAPIAAEPALAKPKIASTAIHLRLVPGFPNDAANYLGERGVQTLADLDAKRDALRKLPGQTMADRYAALKQLEVPSEVVYQAGDALVDYEAAQQTPEPAPAKKPAKKRKRASK